MTRRGFSLLEILIVAGLLLTLVAGAALYQISGQRQSVALDFKAASLQTAQLVFTRLQQDLAGMVPGPLAESAAAPAPQPFVQFARVSDQSDARGLPLDGRDQLQTEMVSWKFDPLAHALTRNGERIRVSGTELVEFTSIPCRPGDPSPPYGDTLLVRLVIVPPEAVGKVTPATPRSEYAASFHSSQGTINHLHEDWAGDR